MAAERKGITVGPWSDPTFTASDSEIHSPEYFKDYSDFEEKLQALEGEHALKMFLTKKMYDKYKDKKTKLGVTLDKCIKGGIDSANLGMDKWNAGKVGFLFGDAECTTAFKDLVDPIMKWRHDNPKLPHPRPNLNGSKLLDHKIIDSDYVISTRVRTGRSISGFPLSPCISADQRKELEKVVTSALVQLDGNLKGDYYPLAGSNTYPAKPGGIDKATEQRLIDDHFLFQEPHDEPMLLSWRMERDWPHGRGIYHNDDKNALVWVNEEDHLRIMSMQKGPDIRAVFDRFADMVKAVEKTCKDNGIGLVIDKRYGAICSCPSNCGTGLRSSMMLKVPLACKQPNFKKWLADRKLQARGSGGFASGAKEDGIRDVSNSDRMGKDEVQLVNIMIKGVAELIEWEKSLEKLEKGIVDMKVTNKKGSGFYVKAAKAFFTGTEDKDGNKKDPIKVLNISGLGDSINVAVAAAAGVESEKLGVIKKIETSYPDMSGGDKAHGCARIEIEIHRA